jgi:sterol desaturase/sphingolipid hydroxylase (fatty acid hydroxylase superfamily)
MFPEIVKGFIVLFFIFVPLERVFSLHKQKIFRTGWRTDAAYFFIGHFFGGAGTAVSVFVTFSLLDQLINPTLPSRIAAQPVWLQFIEAVVIADIGYYLAHKLLHTNPWLWKFHAVHHSIEQMDWLATVRVHPFDQIFTKTCQMIPLYFLGVTPETLGVYALFSAAIAFFIHANFRVKFGVLRWVIATPEFHHWHHSQVPRVHNKNFAAQLPLLDWLFGTLYLPTRKMPHRYGVSELVPAGYLGQILYPFRGELKMENEAFKKGISRYLRPLPVILCLTFIGVSAVSIGAVVNHMDVPTFIASFNTQQVTVAELQQGKLKAVILIDVRSRLSPQIFGLGGSNNDSCETNTNSTQITVPTLFSLDSYRQPDFRYSFAHLVNFFERWMDSLPLVDALLFPLYHHSWYLRADFFWTSCYL